MLDFIQAENKKIREGSLWRTLSVLKSSRCNEIVLDGHKLLNFSSNDYLGYSHHPQVLHAAQAALKRYGAGGRSSRLISGSLEIHRELEEKLAKFKSTESSLVFPTGFMANLGVISALLGEGDAVLMDRLNHASLIDAAKLSRARLFVYSHCSVESLDRVLRRTRSYRKRLVVTDSLFSMDGDFAPLKEIREICSREKVWLMIDDAHATGVLGKNGIGLAEHFGLLGKIEIVMGTLSKALGSQGGFVCGSQDLIQHLVNRARPFIYTTALAPSACAAAIASLDLVQKEPQKRKYLLSLSQTLRKGLKRIFPDYSTGSLSPKGRVLKDESETSSPPKRFVSSQIVPWVAGSSEQALKVALTLRSAGIYAPAIRPPTVPQGESRLRFSLTSEHTQKDVNYLLSALVKNTDSLSSLEERDGVRSLRRSKILTLNPSTKARECDFVASCPFQGEGNKL